MKRAFLLGSLMTAALCGQAPSGGSIEGQVVNQVTNAPVRRATVSLQLSSLGRSVRPGEPMLQSLRTQTETDDQGNYQFRNLEPGLYQLSAQRAGFVGLGMIAPASGMFYSLSSNGIQATTDLQVYLGSGQALAAYSMPLVPQAVIAGKVTDRSGDPAPGCQVLVWRWGYQNGKRQLVRLFISGSQISTNDLGEYRIPGLPAGSYFVSATPQSRNNYNGTAEVSPQPKVMPVTTYYPAAVEAAAATAVQAAAGKESAGINIQLAERTTYVVRGRVIDPEGGQAFAYLRARGNAGGLDSFGSSFAMDGTFSIAGVPPGSYDLVGQRSNSGAAPSRPVQGVLPVEVTNANVEGLVLRVAPPRDLEGMVKTEACRVPGLSVRLTAQVFYSNMPSTAGVVDGKFVFQSVPAGVYGVAVEGGRCYVKTVMYAGKEIPESGVLMDGSGTIEVVMGEDSGRLRGSVVDASGNPAPRALVVAVRKDAVGTPSPQAVSRASGFNFIGLRPGSYDLYAWEEVDSSAISSPEYLKQYERQKQEVTVEPNGLATVQLTLIPAAAEGVAPRLQLKRNKGSLEGRVERGAAGGRADGVDVSLRSSMAALPGGELVARTDTNGRFTFPDLEPGIYYARTGRANRAPNSGANSGALQASQIVVVGDGQKVAGFVVRVEEMSAIVGKVVDEAGDPLQDFFVSPYRYQYLSGERRLVAAGAGAQTDDRGQYRLPNLSPGAYYLCVTRARVAGTSGGFSGRAAGAQLQAIASEPETGYAPTWYPNVGTVDAASKVTVRAGGETPAVDFKLSPSRLWRVRGQITGSTAPASGPAAGRASDLSGAGPIRAPEVTLYPMNMTAPLARVMAGGEGRFEFTGVASGAYKAVVREQDGSQTRMAIAEVEVKDAPVDGVRLEVSAGRDIRGKLKIEGAMDYFTSGLTLVSKDLEATARQLSSNLPVRSGDISFTNVFRSSYSLDLMIGTNVYIQSVRYGGREYPPNAVDLSGDGELEIVVSGTPAMLEGVVVDQAGKPAPGAAILALPANGSGQLKSGWADSQGRFSFRGCAPGEYKVAAWAAQAAEALDLPASLEPYGPAVKTLRLQPGSQEKYTLTAIAPK